MRRTLFAINTVLLFLPTMVGAFCFEDAGRVYGISPTLLKGIARVESGLNPAAINRNRNGTVDLGLMQVNSFWLKPLGVSAQELVDKPCYNVMVGAWILGDCLNRHGKTWKAIGCYNAAGHEKRVNYSWKIYRELLNEKKASGRKSSKESVLAHVAPLPKPPAYGDVEADSDLYGGVGGYSIPIVSSIELTVTEK